MSGIDRKALEKLFIYMEKAQYPFRRCRFRREKDSFFVLGEGSSAIVYEMVDKTDEKTRYALKIAGLGDYMVKPERFYSISEANRMFGIKSENAVSLIDARELFITGTDYETIDIQETDREYHDKEGIVLQFYLMEKLMPIVERKRGKIFLLREKLFEEREICHLAIQIGKALSVVHANGYVHGDVKLENIFWDAENDRYKLGDFETIACQGDIDGMLVGTNGYVPPEIKRRRMVKREETEDIYSLGICLFVLLNHLAFPGSSGYWVNEMQYEDNFVLPKPDHVSVQIISVIRKMCSHDRERRYQLMTEVIAVFEKLILEDG